MNDFTYFLSAACGALFGWLTVGLSYLLYKRLKSRKPKPKKKNVCLLVGNPGSGAKDFLNNQKELQEEYSEVLFHENLQQAEREIKGLFSLETPIDTFLIYGYFSLVGTGDCWEKFLTRLSIKHDYRHPLYHYVPDPHQYITGTVVKLTKKDGYWLLQKLRAEDHKIIY